VQPAAPLAPPGHAGIDVAEGGRTLLEIALAVFDRMLELALERVGLSPDALARFRVEAR